MPRPAFWQYATRITPILSCGFLVLLIVFSFAVDPFGVTKKGKHHGDATPWQLLLCSHLLMLHVLSTFFPLRTFSALGHLITNIHEKRDTDTQEKDLSPLENATVFAIVIPAYKEDAETLRRTLSILGSHPRARSLYHVYLALEEREENVLPKAVALVAAFKHYFYDMSFTLHPAGLPNEVPGKSSNENWAARQISKDYPVETRQKDVLITTMDADTHLPAIYFDQVLEFYTTASPKTRTTTMYMPPLVFDRNLHQVPLPVRTADMMWACAGISSMYSGTQVCIPTSVYTLPLDLVEQVGGWDTDEGSIGEDMHMYLKCFFAVSGNLSVQVIYAAASQCNVSTGMSGISGYVRGLLARYEQAVRHMWGALDTGYAVRQACQMLIRAFVAVPTKSKHEEVDSAKSNGTVHPFCKDSEKKGERMPRYGIHIINVCTVFLRLFEAHLLPIQLAVVLTTSDLYMFLYPSFLIPVALRMTLDFCSVCRAISYVAMLAVFYRYEQYHRLCIGLRREEMRKVGLLDEEEEDDFSPNVFQSFGILEAALFPLGGFIFGVFPALHAIFTHLFTERLVYKVSLKPQLLLKPQPVHEKQEVESFSEYGGPTPPRASLEVASRSSSDFSDAV